MSLVIVVAEFTNLYHDDYLAYACCEAARPDPDTFFAINSLLLWRKLIDDHYHTNYKQIKLTTIY